MVFQMVVFMALTELRNTSFKIQFLFITPKVDFNVEPRPRIPLWITKESGGRLNGELQFMMSYLESFLIVASLNYPNNIKNQI